MNNTENFVVIDEQCQISDVPKEQPETKEKDDINIVANLNYYPSKSLRTICKRVDDFENMQSFVDLMFNTMILSKGVGLSANQIGVSSQIFVLRTPDMRKAFINPKITPEGDERHNYTERDLSFPGIDVRIKRHSKVKVEFQDQFGNPQMLVLSGTEAVIAQHEYEHLQGKTFIDQLSRLRRTLIESKVKKTLKQWQHGNKQLKRKVIAA